MPPLIAWALGAIGAALAAKLLSDAHKKANDDLEALRREPRLHPGIQRAIEVADGSVDGWQLVWGAARSAMSHGAKVLTYHRVTRIEREGGRVSAVLCRDEKGGEDVRINCTFVLNCAGPWAGQIAEMAGAAM